MELKIEGIFGNTIQMDTIDQGVVITGMTEDNKMLVEWQNAIPTTLLRMDSLVMGSGQEEVRDESSSQTRSWRFDDFLWSW